MLHIWSNNVEAAIHFSNQWKSTEVKYNQATSWHGKSRFSGWLNEGVHRYDVYKHEQLTLMLAEASRRSGVSPTYYDFQASSVSKLSVTEKI